MTHYNRMGHSPVSLSATDYYYRRREQRQLESKSQEGLSYEDIIHHENLLRAYRRLKQIGGRAPGPDGINYEKLSPSEVAENLRALSLMLRKGNYSPSEGRKIVIPKASGQGHRTLFLRNILDRVVARALNDALSPIWEQVFLPNSLGFRPKRGVWDFLIQVNRTVIEEDCWVLAIDDVTNAFDNVILNDVINDHRSHISDDKLLTLIQRVLQGPDTTKTKGIEQGNPYSPTALNVRLHYAHDLPMQDEGSNPSWYRYADNLVYPCRDVSEGHRILDCSRHLLSRNSLPLKCESPVHLGEYEIPLMGFRVSQKEGRLGFRLTEKAWRGLERDLGAAHQAENPPACAFEALRGWIAAYGPAFEDRREEILDRIIQTSGRFGFEEVTPKDQILQEMKSAWGRFRRRLRDIRLIH